MAEGSYGSPFYQGNIAPVENTSSTAKFATNVNRKKTRKWVEAKKVNYDGSGWGDEDDEDEDDGYGDEPMPPMPANAAPTPLPSQSSLAPSGVTVGGAHPTAALRARNSPSPMGRVPMNVQQQAQQSIQHNPQQPQQAQQAQQQQQAQWRQVSPAPAAARAPPQLRTSSPGTGIGGVAPPPQSQSQSQSQPGNYPPFRDGRSESPLGPRGQSPAVVVPRPGTGPAGPRTMSPAGGPNGPRGKFIRPSDIYKRADSIESIDRGRKELPTAPATSAIVSNNTTAPIGHPQPQTEAPSQAQHKPQDSVDSTASAEDAANDRRYSTSPKLPDLARFSTFSPDLLFGGSGGGFMSSDAPPPVPSIPNSPAVGAFPESVTAAAGAPAVSATPAKHLSSVAENVASTSRDASPFSTSSRESASAAPVRDSATTAITASSLDDTPSTTTAGARGSADSTPSSVDGPAAGAAADRMSAATAENRKSAANSAQEATTPLATDNNTDNASTVANTAADQQTAPTPAYSNDPMIAMTAPLNPHRFSSMVPFMPPPVTTPKGPRDIQRSETAESTPTTTTAANSPVKESDVLREEIIRTLSPVKATHSDESLEGTVKDSTASAVEDKEVGARSADAPTSQNRSEHTRTLTRESSYLQDVYDDYWTPDDTSGNDTYTTSDPPPPIPPLASAGAGAVSGPGATSAAETGADSAADSVADSAASHSVTPAAVAATAAATAAVGAAALAASGHSSSSASFSADAATPQPQPAAAAESQHTHQLRSQQGLAPSPSPNPSASGVPGAFPSSNVPTPGADPAPTTQPVSAQAAAAAFSNAPGLRRRFSWEAEPEQAAENGTGAFTAVRASTMATPPSSTQPQSQSPPPSLDAMQVSSPVSNVPPPNELQPQQQHDRTMSPHGDSNTVVSAVSTSTVAPELTAPSPVSDAAVPGAPATTKPTAAAEAAADSSEYPAQDAARPSKTQAPVRSMLDVGDAPALTPIRSMLDVGDDPLPKQLVNRISTAESMQSSTSFQSQSQSQSQSQNNLQSQTSPTAAPSIHVYQPAAPVVSPTSPAALGSTGNNPALFGSATGSPSQTLRQCMALDSHHDRMAKLAEARHEYAVADSGLSSWLQSMTAVPEYARAAYAPLFDNQVGGAGLPPSGSASRPVAAVAATMSRVPHVHVAVPSGTQISNKSKEIFNVATGKAGKGLLALRKKGFHKKSAN
ncbi:hypothetical protein HMPREF1624_04995 [Sporothrix schenckii ATCC 58251]|uniref:Uncharacterized protein n=1 Tax=Sporothrix schenckii (strain ATCC 58251 / de Perez 2211183) TaxID=1391915 RepID=U7PRJ2_SPOS1|nr:hypothetical protein HMPREF1624_04995 [Sporothrix schenckii ATCC 58251]